MDEADAVTLALQIAKESAEAAREAAAAAKAAKASAGSGADWLKTWATAVLAGAGALVGGLLALGLVVNSPTLFRMIRGLTSLKIAGFEMAFQREAVPAMDDAVIKKERDDAYPVHIPNAEKQKALERARKYRAHLDGARLLWVDDYPANNDAERHLFEAFGARVSFATTNAKAAAMVEETPFDLIISDIERPYPPWPAHDEGLRKHIPGTGNSEAAKAARADAIARWQEDAARLYPPQPALEAGGLDLIKVLRPEGQRPAVIFYIGNYNPNVPKPPGVFQITNRPDHLLLYAIEVLRFTRQPG